MRGNENHQKSVTGTLFCCFTVLVTSDRNIIFPINPMGLMKVRTVFGFLYSGCILQIMSRTYES